jgi:hypothetical protein
LLETEAATLREQNLATETKLEDERGIRLELEKSLAPRALGFQFGPGAQTNFDELKPFSGLQVLVEILPDAEAMRAGSSVLALLKNAGWNVVKVSYNPELYTGFFDGVIIMPSPYPPLEKEPRLHRCQARTNLAK